MKVVALIPARGGSKRIKDKNIVDVCGKPLISYVIQTALNCELIDEVWVSTNCPKIAEVSKNFGAKVQDRPNAISGDTASSESAIAWFTSNYNETTSFDSLVFMQATSPLTQIEHLTQGIQLIVSGKADSCLSVCEDFRFYWDSNRNPINYDPNNRPFTQDKEKWYKETGAFYITTKKGFLSSQCRINGKVEFVIVPEIYSYEIDTYDDLFMVENALNFLKR